MTNGDLFHRVLIADWSAAASPSPRRPTSDAIWIAEAGETRRVWYLRTREAAMALISQRISSALKDRRRILCGFDFAFGYPAGFARAVAGRPDALALWAELAAMVEDRPDNSNNRFAVAARLNRLFPGLGPFWGCPTNVVLPDLPHNGLDRAGHGLPEHRLVEDEVPQAQSHWKLFTAGAVGSQALLGIARLHALRQRFGEALCVWPFQAPSAPVVLAEVYPSLLERFVRQAPPGTIRDRAQVQILAEALADMGRRRMMGALLSAAQGPDLAEEGWILGAAARGALRAAAENAMPRIDFRPEPAMA